MANQTHEARVRYPFSHRHLYPTHRVFLFSAKCSLPVKNNPEPLCADSFSGFGLQNKEKHNEEIRRATRRLEDTVIPGFAKILDQQFSDQSNQTHFSGTSTFSEKIRFFKGEKILDHIGNRMHRIGINLRYLGLVVSHVKNQDLLKLLHTEIVARSLKNIARAKMRLLQSGKESDYLSALVNTLYSTFLGLQIGLNGHFWSVELIEIANRQYGTCITQPSVSFQFQKSEIDWWLLYLRLSGLLGFRCALPLKSEQDLRS